MNEKIKSEFGMLAGGLGAKITDTNGNSLKGFDLTCKDGRLKELNLGDRAKINQDISALSPLGLPWTTELEVPNNLQSPLEKACGNGSGEALSNKKKDVPKR